MTGKHEPLIGQSAESIFPALNAQHREVMAAFDAMRQRADKDELNAERRHRAEMAAIFEMKLQERDVDLLLTKITAAMARIPAPSPTPKGA